MKKILEKQSGITLIALIMTIIILLILAGVTINLALGENGLLNRTKEAREKYEIATAKEYIEIKINECILEKGGDASLQDIIDYLAEDSTVTYYVALEEVGLVAGEVDIGSPKEVYVVYNNYQFKLDESKKVEFISVVDVDLEGKVSIEAQVKSYLGKNENGKYEASVLLKATGDAEISRLEIQNPDGTTLTLEPDGLTTVGKDMTIEFDKTYKVILTTSNGHKYTKRITEKSEETITTAEQLASFRDKVNSGLTYEGKTVKLGSDIDLSTVCGANVGGKEISWEPIGYYKSSTDYCYFNGTFDGNYHRIENMYIKNKQNSSLFVGINKEATVKKMNIGNAKILNNENEVSISFLVNNNYGTINQCKINNNCIVQIGVNSHMYLGGVSVSNFGNINECINCAKLIGTSVSGYVYVGGIVSVNTGNINNCYNIGNLSATTSKKSMVGGINGENQKGTISNCYNIGLIQEGNFKAGVVARNGYDSSSRGIINNCFYLNTTQYQTYDNGVTGVATNIKSDEEMKQSTFSSTLGNIFTSDIQNKDGTWKYNNGYPILKWQLQENQVTEN